MGASIMGRLLRSSGLARSGGGADRPAVGACHADLGNLSLIEVSDATALAGPMFAKAFKADIPRFPRHFVLLFRGSGTPSVIGYVHHTRFGDAYLAGGLVVRALHFRKLDHETAALVRKEGGLAEWIMRTTCGWLDAVDAVFAYMGEKRSIRVNLRVGFVPTQHPHLHVLWKRPCSPQRMRALIEKVAARGSF